MEEVLVILAADNPAAAQAAREQVKASGGQIRQSYGRDVLIVEASPATRSLSGHPGVLGVYEGKVPGEFSKRLDETGRLGVAAWNQRHTASFRAAKKRRKGEGLPWDHPGCEPEG